MNVLTNGLGAEMQLFAASMLHVNIWLNVLQPGVLVCVMCRLQCSCMVCMWPIGLMYSCMCCGLLRIWCTVTTGRLTRRLVYNWMYVYSSASRLVYSYFSYAIQELLYSPVYSSAI